MNPRRLRTAALAFFVTGLWLTVISLLPAALAYEDTRHSVAPQIVTEPPRDEVLPPALEKPLETQILTNQRPSKTRLVKTTCYTDIELRGRATEQGIKVGEVATNLAPQGSLIRLGGTVHKVHSFPDDKTDADIFWGFTQEDRQDCLRRGVKYLTFEMIN